MKEAQEKIRQGLFKTMEITIPHKQSGEFTKIVFEDQGISSDVISSTPSTPAVPPPNEAIATMLPPVSNMVDDRFKIPSTIPQPFDLAKPFTTPTHYTIDRL